MNTTTTGRATIDTISKGHAMTTPIQYLDKAMTRLRDLARLRGRAGRCAVQQICADRGGFAGHEEETEQDGCAIPNRIASQENAGQRDHSHDSCEDDQRGAK